MSWKARMANVSNMSSKEVRDLLDASGINPKEFKPKFTWQMSDTELYLMGFTPADIAAGRHLPPVSGAASNSTQLITDMASAIANAPFSTTAQTNANAAAGPIVDLQGNMTIVKLKFQEAAEILAYILSGSQVQGSLTAPTGGPITSAADSSTYNLLVGIYQILK